METTFKETNNNMRILVLVGPKGCGKTYIGQLLQSELPNTTFLEVEQIAMDFLNETGKSADSWKDKSFRVSFFNKISDKIRDIARSLSSEDISTDSILVFETTGAAPEVVDFLDDIQQKIGPVQRIRVRASPSTCAKRIGTRDKSKQVHVPMEMIENLHKATEALDWPWDLVLENEGDLTTNDILGQVLKLLNDRSN